MRYPRVACEGEMHMVSTLAMGRYYAARRFMRDGHRDWALTVVGELLQSPAGREHALCLLAEMYPDDPDSAVCIDMALLPGTPAARNNLR